MEKKNKIIFSILILITIIVIGICGYFLINSKIFINDANRFRNEYMELNDKVTSKGIAFPNTFISETNTVEYISAAKAIDIIENGSGVIYFGFSNCPWCRTLVTPLTNIAEQLNETIYYLDISNIRSTFTVENSKLTKTKDGSKDYYKLIEVLGDYLSEYYLEDSNGNRYETNEKRIYAPTLIAVSDGKITDMHVGTVETQKTGYDKLTNEQKIELEEIITNLINSKNK